MKRSVMGTPSIVPLCNVDRPKDSDMGLIAKQRKLTSKKAEVMKQEEKVSDGYTASFIKESFQKTAYLELLRNTLDTVKESVETESSKLRRYKASVAHVLQMIDVGEAITNEGGIGDDAYMTELSEKIERLKIDDQMREQFEEKLNALERSLKARIETGVLKERISRLSGLEQKVASVAARVESREHALTKDENEIIDELAYLHQENVELDQSMLNLERSKVELLADREEKIRQLHVLEEEISKDRKCYAALENKIGNAELDITTLETRINEGSILDQLLVDQENHKTEIGEKEGEILRYKAEIQNALEELERHQQQMVADSEKAEKTALRENLMKELNELRTAKVILDEELAGLDVIFGGDREADALHFEEQIAQLKKTKTEKEKEIVHLQTVLADYRSKLVIVNQKMEMVNNEQHMEKLTSQKQLLQKAYLELEGKSETINSSLIDVMLRRNHLKAEMASLSTHLSHRPNDTTRPVGSVVSYCKNRNVMRTPGAGDVAMDAKINNVAEGAERKGHRQLLLATGGRFADEHHQHNHRQKTHASPPHEMDNRKQMWINALEALSPSPLKRTSVQPVIEAFLDQMGHQSGRGAESSSWPSLVTAAVNGRTSNRDRVAPHQCVLDCDVSQHVTTRRYPSPPSPFASPISGDERARIDAYFANAGDFPPEAIESDIDQSTWSLFET